MNIRASFLWATAGILFHLFMAMFATGFVDWIDEKQEAPSIYPAYGKPHHGFQIHYGEPFEV